jgi:outer membrane receptor for monomeric catechols
MPTRMLRTAAVIILCFSNGAIAVAGERPRQAPAADRDPYVDPAAPYKADRLSAPRGQKILDIPGQTTILTREVLDDMKATSLKDALRSTAGVTVGR